MIEREKKGCLLFAGNAPCHIRPPTLSEPQVILVSMRVMVVEPFRKTNVLHSHQQSRSIARLASISLQCPELPGHFILNLGLNKGHLAAVPLESLEVRSDRRITLALP